MIARFVVAVLSGQRELTKRFQASLVELPSALAQQHGELVPRLDPLRDVMRDRRDPGHHPILEYRRDGHGQIQPRSILMQTLSIDLLALAVNERRAYELWLLLTALGRTENP